MAEVVGGARRGARVGGTRIAALALIVLSALLLSWLPRAQAQAQSQTQTQTRTQTQAQTILPAPMLAALQSAGIPEAAVSVVVQEVGASRPLLAWQSEQPRNPASLAKLVVTQAALDRLGPAWTWTTPVWLVGPVEAGVLQGSLHIKGGGDPKLVLERIWLLLRRVQQLGVREIRGDIVLDQSAFAPSETSSAEFDGEPLRPYNVRPAALLLNYRSILYTFTPDAAAGVARIGVEPALARHEVARQVPLAEGACNDWRAALKAQFEEERTRFFGRYPAACAEQVWPVADVQPQRYEARLLEGMWLEMGGTLAGRVREGPAPLSRPTFEFRSPPLAEVVRDINKFSNNVMAEQLLLTLALQDQPVQGAQTLQPATPQAARAWLERWMTERLGVRKPRPGAPVPAPDPTPEEAALDNGSGLSRGARLSARLLMRLLQLGYAAPTMPEWLSSLPVSGNDGTLRRMRSAGGQAHLKSGSLRDAAGLAGVVHGAEGRRALIVAMVHHPQAGTARPALEALVQWVQEEALAPRAARGRRAPN